MNWFDSKNIADVLLAISIAYRYRNGMNGVCLVIYNKNTTHLNVECQIPCNFSMCEENDLDLCITSYRCINSTHFFSNVVSVPIKS